MSDWRSSIPFVDRDVEVTTDNCRYEPIHLKPYLQAGGALLAWNGDTIVATSANLAAVLSSEDDDLVGCSVRQVMEAAGLEFTAATDGSSNLLFAGHELTYHHSPVGPEILEFYHPDADEPLEPGVTLIEAIGDLREAGTAGEAASTAATVLRAVGGYDRVWVYRFHDDGHGEVIAEAKRPDLPAFLGLHYPATDIPEAARRLFLENPVRIIGDVAGDPVPIIEDISLASPLDISQVTLRGVSPIHVAYLRGMGATASMSLALTVGGRLWGLLSAHHYSGVKRPSFATQRVCEALASVVSLHIDGIERTAEAELRTELVDRAGAVLSRAAGADSLLEGLVASGDDLLAMTAASGAIIRVAGRVRSVGTAPDRETTNRLFEALESSLADSTEELTPIVVESITDLDPSIDQPGIVAGVLALPLAREPGNWIIWLRPEYVRTVTWGDNSRGVSDNHRPLSPEDSFRQWTETVAGRSRPWSPTVVDAATHLRSSLGVLVLRRSEQLARSVAALQTVNRELDRFAYVAAHDLNEPLRGIVNYMDVLEEDAGDDLPAVVRPYVDAVRDLAERMAGLVDSLLTYASVGRQQLQLESIRLSDLVDDAERLVQRRLAEAGATVRMVNDRALTGDRVQLVQVLSNLIGNAAKYRGDADPLIEVEALELHQTGSGPARWPRHHADIPPPAVIAVRDNGIGIPEEHRETVFEVFRRLHGTDEYGGGSGAGLTIARRIAERHGGNLWHEPNEPNGSVFYLAIADPGAHLAVDPDG